MTAKTKKPAIPSAAELGFVDVFKRIHKGELAAVKSYLDAGLSPSTTGTYDRVEDNSEPSLLAYAIDQKQEAIALLLIERDAEISVENEYGHSLLYAAAYSAPILQALLDKGADLKAVDAAGSGLLYAAAGKGSCDAALLLAAAGADVHRGVVINGEVYLEPIHQAANMRDIAMIECLESLGADIHVRTRYGYGMFHCASASWQNVPAEEGIAFLSYLKGRGLDIDAKDVDGNTALYSALLGGSEDYAIALLNAGANPDIANRMGKRPEDQASPELRAMIQSWRARRAITGVTDKSSGIAP